MRFADDTRGRIPFALLGVLLLVSASAHASVLAGRDDAVVDDRVATALDRVESEASTALHTAVREAIAESGRAPVTRPANTSVGRALNATSPFRDAFRLRVAVAARQHFARLNRTVDGVRVAVVTSPVAADSTPAVRAAIDGVAFEEGDGTVRIGLDVSLRATRGGRVVASRPLPLSVRAETSLFSMHDRTTAFARRLDASPVAPGLGRGLSARLYPLVWARAYGQFGGAPVENVLANRHVELSLNAALLAEQRRAYGAADPSTRRELGRATTRVLASDLLEAASLPPEVADVDVEAAADSPEPTDSASAGDSAVPGATSDAVGLSADVALVETVPELDDVLAESYRVEATFHADVERLGGPRSPPPSPGPGWALANERTTRSVTVERAGAVADAATESQAGPVTLATYDRVVTVTRTSTLTWRRDGERTETTHTDVVRYRVRLRVAGEYAPDDGAPDRPVSPLYADGGRFGGENLGSVESLAVERFVTNRGGADELARKAALGKSVADDAVLFASPPSDLRPAAVTELASLRDRLADVSVSVSPADVAGGRANSAADLAATLRERRAAFVDAPARYDGVAHRALVAARASYLSRVAAELDGRAERTDRANERVNDTLSRANVTSAVRGVDVPSLPSLSTPAPADDRPLTRRLSPEATPGYLGRAPVTRERVPGLSTSRTTTLAVRNRNVFSLPSEEVGDAVAGALVGPETVDLRVAARTLVDAESVPVENATAAARRAELRASVADSLSVVRSDAARKLRFRTSLSPGERHDALTAAFGRWESVGTRALAATNGSLATALAAEVARRDDVADAETALLRSRLRVALAASRQSGATHVPAELVGESESATRAAVRSVVADEATAYTERAAERALDGRFLGRALGPVLAGLPVAPVPGYWYATVNVWVVSVRGGYDRFAVAAPVGSPDGTGGRTVYVRDGARATLDVDGDGETETLGRAERVDFSVTTAVVVAVPPAGRGVGDVAGPVDERSAAWPCPETVGGDDCPADDE